MQWEHSPLGQVLLEGTGNGKKKGGRVKKIAVVIRESLQISREMLPPPRMQLKSILKDCICLKARVAEC